MSSKTKAQKGAKPKKEMMAAKRKLKRSYGLVPIEIWALQEDKAALKAIEAESQKKAGYSA